MSGNNKIIAPHKHQTQRRRRVPADRPAGRTSGARRGRPQAAVRSHRQVSPRAQDATSDRAAAGGRRATCISDACTTHIEAVRAALEAAPADAKTCSYTPGLYASTHLLRTAAWFVPV